MVKLVSATETAAIDEAVAALEQGLVIAMPTDTVYGVAVDPFRPDATARLFAAKHRPRDVALPVLVAAVSQLDLLCSTVSETALALMDRFWPGPLTIVVPRRPGLAADLGTSEATVGVRCPDHPVPLALCGRVGPLATTSANLHGRPTPPTAVGVADVFGPDVAVVIDGGPCDGSPSTVVDCTETQPRLIREGALAWDDVLAAAQA